MREEDVCLEMFLAWLAARHGRRFSLDQAEQPEPGVVAATATDGSIHLAVEVHQLLEPVDNQPWLAHRDVLQGEIAMDLPGAYALWLPPGADLPSGAGETADLVKLVRETALTLEPGQRSYLALPIAIYLKKQGPDGGLVSVVGGLNAYWARLTERVKGTYDLDSSRLHRLPESEEHLRDLSDRIIEEAAGIEAVGQWVEIDTIDSWTIHRLDGDSGVTIIGRPPQEVRDVSLTVRRNFRRLLAGAGPRLRGRQADVRALVVVGHYGRMEQEGVSTAMRGFDPTLYSGFDFVCLAADGLIKALMEAPSRALPWS